MSSTCDHVSEHRLCYVHCNYCNTILAVSVPCSSLFNIVTVRCGQCTQLLSVNMGTALHPLPTLQPEQPQKISDERRKELTSSSTSCEKATTSMHTAKDKAKTICRGTPEKRSQRVPSAYNRFIKEEIQRIKARKPDIRHREAFSTAAKNWAHFPSMNFGLMEEKKNKAILSPDVNKMGIEVECPPTSMTSNPRRFSLHSSALTQSCKL